MLNLWPKSSGRN